MFPSTAPKNGPSSSFEIAQDRLSTKLALQSLFTQVDALDDVHDPRAVTLATPALGSALQVGLPSGGLTLNGHYGLLPAMSLSLAADALTYVSAAPVGVGQLRDFPGNTLLAQSVGTYAGGYQVIPSALVAASPLNLSAGNTLVQRYYAYMTNVNGGWGPALVDAYGNGLIIRAAALGGGLFVCSGYAASGTAVALLPQHSVNDTNLHVFELRTTYMGDGQYNTVLLLDTVQVLNVTDAFAVDPGALFPAFISDGTTVFLSGWQWQNLDGSPVFGWVAQSVALGAAAPDPPTAGMQLFLIETGAAPLSIRALYQQKTVITQLAAMRATLASLQKAYL